MSILLKGIEMPEEDEEIMIRIDSSGTIMTEYGLPISGTKAIPVHPHGCLIDADAMITSVKKQIGFLKIMGGDLATIAKVLEKGILQEIENAPVIIEAEDGET